MNILLTKTLIIYIVLGSMCGSCLTFNTLRTEVKRDPQTESGHKNNALTNDDKYIIQSRISQNIFFLDNQVGWSWCGKHKICVTRDGGESWNLAYTGKFDDLKGMFFINENVGWAILDNWNTPNRSNSLIKTADGGKHWEKVLEIDSPIYSVSFIDKEIGIVSARWTALHKTIDGGRSWKKLVIQEKDQEDSSAIREGMHYVVYVGKNNLLGVGGGIWSSEDGGKDWESLIDAGEDSQSLFAMSFIDDKNGWVVGHESKAWRTTDGKSFHRVEIPESLIGDKAKNITFHAVSFVSSEEGWISGRNTFPSENQTEKLFHTNNSGKSWELIYESDKELGEIKFMNSKKGFAIDSETDELLQTTDGGRTWFTQTITTDLISDKGNL